MEWERWDHIDYASNIFMVRRFSFALVSSSSRVFIPEYWHTFTFSVLVFLFATHIVCTSSSHCVCLLAEFAYFASFLSKLSVHLTQPANTIAMHRWWFPVDADTHDKMTYTLSAITIFASLDFVLFLGHCCWEKCKLIKPTCKHAYHEKQSMKWNMCMYVNWDSAGYMV